MAKSLSEKIAKLRARVLYYFLLSRRAREVSFAKEDLARLLEGASHGEVLDAIELLPYEVHVDIKDENLIVSFVPLDEEESRARITLAVTDLMEGIG